MQIDPRIFRAYDIRGLAEGQLSEEVYTLVGRGFGSIVREKTGKEQPTIAVGRDMRTHSPAFEAALIKGLTETGCRVLAIGQTPSPVNFFTIVTQELDGGVQVTASHNPKEDNGIKLQLHDAEAFAGEDIQVLRERIESGNFLSGNGSCEEIDAIAPYLVRMSEMFTEITPNYPIAVDCGNGVTGPVYIQALKQAGCNVTELFTEPDGTFPNHPADPSKWETLGTLQETVLSKKCSLGIAFDGDGDRVGIVDETGMIRTADEILLLLAKDHLQRHRGNPVIFTVSNSSTLQSEITAWGGVPVMVKVGHSFVEHAMREYRSLLGGEQSGHFFCGEGYFGFDDALVAALRVLSIISASGKSMGALCAQFPPVFQAPERRPQCADAEKGRVVASVTEFFKKKFPVNTLDGVRIDFGEGAWAGIRQSNTSPRLSICLEARSPEKLEEIERLVMEHMKGYPEVDFE